MARSACGAMIVLGRERDFVVIIDTVNFMGKQARFIRLNNCAINLDHVAWVDWNEEIFRIGVPNASISGGIRVFNCDLSDPAVASVKRFFEADSINLTVGAVDEQ